MERKDSIVYFNFWWENFILEVKSNWVLEWFFFSVSDESDFI